MGTRNPDHKMHKKEVFWQHHVDCWAQTNLTQAHYCRQNELSQSDFSKWKKKLNPRVKKNKRKKPLALKHKESFINYRMGQRANRCSFCGQPYPSVNKLFFGKDDLTSICDYCLWHKAQKLHREVKSYKTIRFETCSVCFRDSPGIVIGNIYYRICIDCLSEAWRNVFKNHPDRHPCRSMCIGCQTEKPEEHFRIGAHIICKNCAEAARSSFLGADQFAAKRLKKCNLCGVEKHEGLSFIECNDIQICSVCVYESYSLLKNSEDKQV